METASEKRARLRRMKILENSEARMSRILEDKQLPQTARQCDNSWSVPEQPRQQLPERHISHPEPGSTGGVSGDQVSNHKTESTPLPPRDESLPRKVSLISSPIHFRTLQQSQRFNSSLLQHPNIINNFRCNASSKCMILLFVLACIGSYCSVNFPTLFLTYESCKYGYTLINRNTRVAFGNVLSELLLSLFSYIMIQVVCQ